MSVGEEAEHSVAAAFRDQVYATHLPFGAAESIEILDFCNLIDQ